MDEKTLLEAIRQIVKEETAPINARLDKLETKVDRLQEDMDELKEYSEITRDGVNTLISWADDVACVVKIPLKAAN